MLASMFGDGTFDPYLVAEGGNLWSRAPKGALPVMIYINAPTPGPGGLYWQAEVGSPASRFHLESRGLPVETPQGRTLPLRGRFRVLALVVGASSFVTIGGALLLLPSGPVPDSADVPSLVESYPIQSANVGVTLGNEMIPVGGPVVDLASRQSLFSNLLNNGGVDDTPSILVLGTWEPEDA